MKNSKRKNKQKTAWHDIKSDKSPEKALFNLKKQLRLYALNLAAHHPYTKEFFPFILSVLPCESQRQLVKYIYSCPRKMQRGRDHFHECLELIATQDEDNEIGSIIVRDIERLRITINQDKFKAYISKLIKKSNHKKGGVFNVRRKQDDIPF